MTAMQEKLHSISGLGAGMRQHKTGNAKALPAPQPMDLDELRDKVARQKRAATAVPVSELAPLLPAPERHERNIVPSRSKPPRTNAGAAGNLARMRKNPVFEAKRIAALRAAIAARGHQKNPQAAERLAARRKAFGFEEIRVAALKASWTPARRAEASKLLAAQKQDPAFRAKHSTAARATINKLRTPEFEARRIAASRGAKKRKKT